MNYFLLTRKAISLSYFKMGLVVFCSLPHLATSQVMPTSQVKPNSPNEFSIHSSMGKAANCTYLGAKVSAAIAGVQLQLAKDFLEAGEWEQAAVWTLLGAKYADDSQKYLESTQFALNAVNETSGTPTSQNTNLPGYITDPIKTNLAVLKKGDGPFKYEPNAKTVTVDTKKYIESDVVSSATMVKAGFSQDFADDTAALVKLVENKVIVKVGDPSKFDECKAQVFVAPTTTSTAGTAGTSGGAALAGTATAASLAATAPGGAQPYSINFNGEPIGVTSAEIFSTITRRYIDMANKGEFIGTQATTLAPKK